MCITEYNNSMDLSRVFFANIRLLATDLYHTTRFMCICSKKNRMLVEMNCCWIVSNAHCFRFDTQLLIAILSDAA